MRGCLAARRGRIVDRSDEQAGDARRLIEAAPALSGAGALSPQGTAGLKIMCEIVPGREPGNRSPGRWRSSAFLAYIRLADRRRNRRGNRRLFHTLDDGRHARITRPSIRSSSTVGPTCPDRTAAGGVWAADRGQTDSCNRPAYDSAATALGLAISNPLAARLASTWRAPSSPRSRLETFSRTVSSWPTRY